MKSIVNLASKFGKWFYENETTWELDCMNFIGFLAMGWTSWKRIGRCGSRELNANWTEYYQGIFPVITRHFQYFHHLQQLLSYVDRRFYQFYKIGQEPFHRFWAPTELSSIILQPAQLCPAIPRTEISLQCTGGMQMCRGMITTKCSCQN